jgi:hypothetical protein
MSALSIVRQHFPEVTVVKDATSNSIVEVTRKDVVNAERRKHRACAYSVACKRKFEADGVIVSLNRVYVVKGKAAIRYVVPESVSREVVSFDRGSDFEPGTYALTAPSKDMKIGTYRGGGHKSNHDGSRKANRKHFTGGIRTVLGSKEIS